MLNCIRGNGEGDFIQGDALNLYDRFGKNKLDTWCWGFFLPNRFVPIYCSWMLVDGRIQTLVLILLFHYYILKGNLRVGLHEWRVTGNPPIVKDENVANSVGNAATEMALMVTVVGAVS